MDTGPVKDYLIGLQNRIVAALESYIGLVEGIVARIRKELGAGTRVIATGGLAQLICKYTDVVDKIDSGLTLKGLKLIGNERRTKRINKS